MGQETDPGDEIAVACGLHEHALLYRERGQFAEAERLCRSAVDSLERVEADSEVLLRLRVRALSTLADLCRSLGRYDEAETFYRRALDFVDAALGPDDLQAASLYRNLGGLEHARGRADLGEPPARWAVKIRERALGPDHPDVADDKAALAVILEAQGRLTEAEELYRQALDIFERTLGREHPRFLACRERYERILPGGR